MAKHVCCICKKARQKRDLIETVRGDACKKHPGVRLVLPWPLKYYDTEELEGVK